MKIEQSDAFLQVSIDAAPKTRTSSSANGNSFPDLGVPPKTWLSSTDMSFQTTCFDRFVQVAFKSSVPLQELAIQLLVCNRRREAR